MNLTAVCFVRQHLSCFVNLCAVLLSVITCEGGVSSCISALTYNMGIQQAIKSCKYYSSETVYSL